MVRKKVLVLDLDETLIHSHHDGVLRPSVKPGTPPDFILKVTIDKHPVRFFVHKRPHVDFFLSVVSSLGRSKKTTNAGSFKALGQIKVLITPLIFNFQTP